MKLSKEQNIRPLRMLITTAFLVVSFANLEAQFIENKGQLDAKILYSKSINSGNWLISEQGISCLFYDDNTLNELYEKSHHPESKPLLNKSSSSNTYTLKYHSIEQQFVGGTIKKSNITEYSEHITRYNFFRGKDKSKWASNVRAFDKLIVKSLYPNIDLELLSTGIELKYNFICHPGSDPSQIKIKYTGAEALQLVGNSIKIKTSLFSYTEAIPVSYIIKNGNQSQNVIVRMKLDGNTVSFTNIPAEFFSSNSTLVIDPKLVFSTYSGSTADNFGCTATYDENGNLYAGGTTTDAYKEIPDGKYPTTPGAFSKVYNGGDDNSVFPCDITISKYSSDGSQLIYATYLGGSDNDYPHSLVVDKSGNLVILGTTYSFNYPVTNTAYSTLLKNNSDIIITKLNSDGSALIGSTFYGGSASDGLNKAFNTRYYYADDYRGDVICDEDGSVLGVISTTSEDIEIKNGFKQTKTKGVQQGLIFKFNNDISELIWSSYVGGDRNSSIYSIDFDQNKDIYVSGGTAGGGIGSTSGSVYPNYMGGRADGYIAKISKDGKTLLKATYFGTDKYDQILSLELDDAGRIYVVGQSEGVIPVKGTVYNAGNVGQFVTILKPDLSEVQLSSTFGRGDNNSDITINAFMVAECNRVFISGWGGESSTNNSSTTRNLYTSTDAYSRVTDGSDFYIMVYSKELREIIYATYFGGDKTADHVDGGTSRFDKKGVIYQSVCSSCPMGTQVGPISDFPVTKGAYAERNVSPRCSNAAFKFAVENLNRKPELRDTLFTVQAFDTITFTYRITDPDFDTLNSVFTSVQGIENDFMSFSKTAYGVSESNSYFSFSPKCKHLSNDTLVILADAKDRGCPDFKTNSAKIRIVVTPPPVIAPPQTICLIFTKKEEINLSWSSIPPSKHFAFMVLYKVFPDGKIVSLDTIRTINGGQYLDKNVIEPRKNNYVYYLKVVNHCLMSGELSYKVSSVQENEFPITPTHIVTATVENNKKVAVHWLQSTEPDFGSYSIYRSENKETLNFEYLTDSDVLTDTTFIDESFDVQTKSYCYSIVVNDRCGKVSRKSNVGCNIILTGVSKPFYHVLDWAPYREWEAGVNTYTLERCVDTGRLRPIVAVVGDTRTFDDRELDYDWGGYWYSVIASENPKGYSAKSRSNSIYLFQPPLLHVPNAFTKNDDNLNETWGFVPVFVKEYHMQVYTRWGEKVFDSYDKHQDWDGNYINLSQGQEVFIWQVTYTGWDRSSHYKKGTVTIIK